MDDSFTDFQKGKKIKTGPKVNPKDKKNKQNKSRKQSKGQKDIRSLIKKNELVSYSQDFDQVCKQSGVDVDAEQLQLAIALSKSLNNFQSSSEDVETQNKQLSSQERSAKIRTTLQEYGFKVNNSKMLSLTTNKRKKYNKHSKLLQISSEEKQQIISNKYSQVLASNICKSPDEDPKCIYSKQAIFYKATNISYDIIKNDETFYVSNLIDKPAHKTCLLRDWSEIPGRPVSPKPMQNNINFENEHYSQDELDNILSGSVDTAQNIVSSKQDVNKRSETDLSKDYNNIKNCTIVTIEPTPSCSNNSKNESQVSQMSETIKNTEFKVYIQNNKKCSPKHNVQENIECIDLINDISFKDTSNRCLKVIDLQNSNSRQFRSTSPDLFDDEVSSIMEDKNRCSIINNNEICSIIEDKNICSTINTNKVCSIIEDKNNCSTIDTNEVCSLIEDKDNCSTINTNEVCSIIEDKNNCSTIDTNEVCSIIEDKNNCSTININEVCSIIEDKDNCSTINTNEVCSIIEDKGNCSTINTNEVCSIIEDKNNCSTIDTNEVCSIIEDKNNCSTIDTNEVCSIIEDKDNCSTINTNEVCSIIEENHNSNRDNISKYDNCGTIFMDLTECANNYTYLNIPNTDITKRKSNDFMDITECVVKSTHNIEVISLEETDDKKKRKEIENVDIVDLTEFPNLVYCSPKINKSGRNKSDSIELDDTIIYENNEFSNLNKSIDLQPLVLDDDESIKDEINDEKSSEYDKRNDSKPKYCEFNENLTNSQNNIENVEFGNNNHDDINIDLTQGSAPSEDLLNNPEFMYDDCGLETEHNSDAVTNIDKDNDIISLKSVSFNNDIENPDDIDLTQDSEKSFDMNEINYKFNCPGTSYNNKSVLENFDDNGTVVDKNNSILSVENIAVNSDFVKENDDDDRIDLTQATEEIGEKNIASCYSYSHKNNSKLGKINNISIDYDEMFDEITSEYRNVSKNSSKNNSIEKDDGSNRSINSEVFEISDRELNYSIHHSIHENVNMDFENRVSLNRSLSDSYVPTVNMTKPLSPIREKISSQPNTPIKINKDIGDSIIETPKNNEYIIKTREVTPMADYESMSTPERNEELEKYGLKPFKRKRAIQLLTYVYNQTHPVIENCSPEEGPSKRVKRSNKYSSPKKNSKSPKKCLDFGSDVNKENDIFIVTKEIPDIGNIECDPKEWVFQNREKAKVHSCRLPLHIAFHNYVSCRMLLREAILRYEPVNIDIIHKELVSYGHKYNPKDLLKFMDRRCITVKTAENNTRNKK